MNFRPQHAHFYALFTELIFDDFFFFDDAIQLRDSFQTVKVDRFVERKVEQTKTTIFLSYLISSHSLWSFKSVKIHEPRHNKMCLWEFPTRPDTNWPAQPQKLA